MIRARVLHWHTQLKDAGVMDEMIYESLSRYFHALELKGYMPFKDMEKLLILIFFKDFVFHDYRGILTLEDYHVIERALECLYGTTCLIPYPDYLKMGKLHLGEMTEMASRIKTIEDTPVVKLMHDIEGVDNDSDVTVVSEDEDK